MTDSEHTENIEYDADRLLDSEPLIEDRKEPALRPKSLDEFVGQENLKEHIHIYIQAAQKRKECIEHLLFYGPPGLGKTTLAGIIAAEMKVSIKTTAGPAIERPGDLASMLTNLEQNDILFIDEIHRLNRAVEEVLYPAMEDHVLDIVIGKGPAARSIRLDLPPFTLIGATTRVGLLTAPLRDRFGIVERLEFYSPEELQRVITRAAGLLETPIETKAALEIAKRSRATPRIANRLLKRVRDWALVKANGDITLSLVEEALNALEIDGLGLDKLDKKYLDALINKFKGGPVGLDTLSACLSEDAGSIEDVIEPYLLQLGFIERSNRGRKACRLAYQHMGLHCPQDNTQSTLF